MDKIDYCVLTDDAEIIDVSKNKTHENIAENLYGLISDNNTPGLTIGLEGKWGSGKSTVIKILSEKLKANPDTFVFYIDTWAHEGDPLRRIFLESFIDSIEKSTVLGEEDKKKLDEFRDKIKYKQKTTIISKLPEVDLIGKIITVSAFLVPLGTVMVDHTFPSLTFEKGYPLNWGFIVGCIFTLAPFIVSLFSILLKIPFFKNKKLEETKETSNEKEKSSVDFNKYFNDLQDFLNTKCNISKIVCIIDNLDRIHENDALKIWSTLQTFVQGKNSTISSEKNPLKMFVIVPYDEQGLRKLWDGNNINLLEKENPLSRQTKTSYANSFFNKSFQLRIYVPQLVLSDWEDFTKKQIEKSLLHYSTKDKKIIINILECTRKSLGDSPTLREIKIYINQIAFLYPLHKKNVSLESLCYYVVLKYLRFKEYDEIVSGLVDGSIPDSSTEIYINRQILTKELCSILFMVPKEEGMQVLLQDYIQNALVKSPDELEKLFKIHGESFFTVLEYILANVKDIDNQKLVINLNSFLRKIKPEKINVLKDYIARKTVQTLILSNLCNYSEDLWKVYVELIYENDKLVADLNKSFTKATESFIQANSENNFIEILYTVILSLGDKSSIYIEYPKIQYSGFEAIFMKLKERTALVAKHIKNLDSFDEDIAARIIDPMSDKRVLLQMIQLQISLKKVLLWTKTVNAIYVNLKAQAMSKSILQLNLAILKELLKCKYSTELENITKEVFKNVTFWNNVYFGHDLIEKYIVYLLFYKYIENIDTFQLRQIYGNAQSCILDAKNSLKSIDIAAAEYLYDLCMPTNDFSYCWKLAVNPTNKLIGNIIMLAAHNQNKEFFAYDNPYYNLRNAVRLISKLNVSDVVKAFIDFSELENKLINEDDFDFKNNPDVVIEILTQSKNKELKNSLTKEIQSTNENEWYAILTQKHNVLDVLFTLIEQKGKIILEEPFYNAFIKYTIDNMNIVSLSSEKLIILYRVMGKSWKQEYSNQMERKLFALKFVVPVQIKQFCISVIKLEYIIEEHKSDFSNLIKQYIEMGKIEELKFIAELINHANKKYIPDAYYSDVLRTSVEKLSDNDLKMKLVQIFSIKIDNKD